MRYSVRSSSTVYRNGEAVTEQDAEVTVDPSAAESPADANVAVDFDGKRVLDVDIPLSLLLEVKQQVEEHGA